MKAFDSSKGTIQGYRRLYLQDQILEGLSQFVTVLLGQQNCGEKSSYYVDIDLFCVKNLHPKPKQGLHSPWDFSLSREGWTDQASLQEQKRSTVGKSH